MTLSMYQASVPVFIRGLGNLSKILDKAASWAEDRKIEPLALTTYRLAPDMLPFAKQIQIACDMATRGAARLAGAEFPSNPDTERSFAEFQQRIARTVAFLKTLPEQKFEGSESRKLTIPMRDREVSFTGQDYLLKFVVPNFYFHLTAAYLILRHNGLELGKSDFIGEI